MIVRIYGIETLLEHKKYLMDVRPFNWYADDYFKLVDLKSELEESAVKITGTGFSKTYELDIQTLEEYRKLYDKLSSVARVKVNSPDDLELTDGMYENEV